MSLSDYRISVLIPAYNAAPYIVEAIKSVLVQTLPATEIIVFDDGSNDNTHSLVQGFGDAVQLIGPKRLGFVAARNHLLELAKQDWIAFHDADDIWLPRKLEIQANWLDTHPDYDGCLGLAEQFLQEGCTLPPNFRTALLDKPTPQLFVPNLLTSRKVFETVGNFSMQDATGADSEWFARCKDTDIKIGVIEQVLYRRRWHDSNLSYEFQFKNNMLDILRQSVQRKRINSAN